MVLTWHGEHGVGISSPQLPGLIAGEPSLEDISHELLWELAHDVHGDELTGVTAHMQRLLELDGQIFALRWKHDYATVARVELVMSIESELTRNPDFRAGWPASELGDVVLSIALPNDTLGPMRGALNPDEPLMIILGDHQHGQSIQVVHPDAWPPHTKALHLLSLARSAAGEGGIPAPALREFQLA